MSKLHHHLMLSFLHFLYFFAIMVINNNDDDKSYHIEHIHLSIVLNIWHALSYLCKDSIRFYYHYFEDENRGSKELERYRCIF